MSKKDNPEQWWLSDLGPWWREEDKGARHVKSAIRTLEVFELFARHQRALTVGEISAELSIPQPSVSMLLKSLCSLGYIERDKGSRRYVPTVRIMLLGTWIQRRTSEENSLDHHMQVLMETVNETVGLAIQNGCYAQYVFAQVAAHPDRMEVQSGLLRPITCTAVGRVLLAQKPEKEAELIVRRCNAAMEGTRHVVNVDSLMGLLVEIRKKGYGWTDGHMTPGYSARATSLPGPVGRTPMSVGVGGPTKRILSKEREIVCALQTLRSQFEEGLPPQSD